MTIDFSRDLNEQEGIIELLDSPEYNETQDSGDAHVIDFYATESYQEFVDDGFEAWVANLRMSQKQMFCIECLQEPVNNPLEFCEACEFETEMAGA